MKKFATIALGSAVALALAGCGSSDDASTDAMADNVEMPADEAMAAVPETDVPAEDAAATQDTADTATDAAAAAGDAAADAAADVEAAASASQ